MARGASRILTRLLVRMVLAMLIAGGVAAFFVYRMDNTYRARVLLNLAPMPFKQGQDVPMNLANLGDPTANVSYLKVQMLEAMAMPDYDLVLTSEAIAMKLRDLLREKYVAAGIVPGNLTLEKVRRALDVRSKVLLQGIDEVEYQQILELYFTAKDPKIAAEMANAWAEMGIAAAEEMRTAGREGAVELLESHLQKAWERFREAKAGLAGLEKEFHPVASEQRLLELEEAVTRLRIRQIELVTTLARLEAEAKISKSEKEGLQEELLGKRAEHVALEEAIQKLEEQAATLRVQLAQAKEEQAALELQADTQRKRIEELSMGKQAMELSASDQVPEFKLASPAYPPEEKTGPHRKLIILVAIFLAAVAVPVHLFGMVALRRYSKTIEAEMEA